MESSSTTFSPQSLLLLKQENTKALAPVFLDYFDASSASELTVTFRRCDFVDNQYYGFPAQPALIVGNSLQNHIHLIECNFERNDMITNNTIVSIGRGAAGLPVTN